MPDIIYFSHENLWVSIGVHFGIRGGKKFSDKNEADCK
jgi:hypothetical protein